jgi:hypothetical protein
MSLYKTKTRRNVSRRNVAFDWLVLRNVAFDWLVLRNVAFDWLVLRNVAFDWLVLRNVAFDWLVLRNVAFDWLVLRNVAFDWLVLLLRIREVSDSNIDTETINSFSWFYSVHKVNVVIAPQIRQWSLLSRSLPIHYSLIHSCTRYKKRRISIAKRN